MSQALRALMNRATTEREIVTAVKAWYRAGAPTNPRAMRAAALALSARYVQTAWFKKLERGFARKVFMVEPTYEEVMQWDEEQ